MDYLTYFSSNLLLLAVVKKENHLCIPHIGLGPVPVPVQVRCGYRELAARGLALLHISLLT